MFNETRALLVQPNSTITVLDLEDNWIDEQGLAYIGDMLQENFYITELVRNTVKVLVKVKFIHIHLALVLSEAINPTFCFVLELGQ